MQFWLLHRSGALTRAGYLFIMVLLCSGMLRAQREPSLPLPLTNVRGLDGSRLDSPPLLIKRGKALYPEHLTRAQNFLQGWVVADLNISSEGNLKSLVVVSSNHPAFTTAAALQLADSRFKPAIKGGVPVESWGRYAVTFDVTGRVGESIGGSVISMPAKPADLPPERDYDTPPWMTRFCEPAHSYEISMAERGGKVKLRVFLDQRGIVERTQVVAATLPELALAMQAAVETWRFVPAQKNGQPTPALFEVEREFTPASFRRPVAENQVIKAIRKGGKSIVTVAALDHPPRLIYRVSPEYPRERLGEKPAGAATIEYYVYETGEVTLPRIVSASQPEFGYAAANAVQQWVYERPRMKGRPVTVRMLMEFEFKP